MDFGAALVRLEDGSKMTRARWPEGVFITLQLGYPEGIAINRNTALATELPEGTVCIFDPYFMEMTPEGHFRPWEPKAVDCLAKDWQWVSDANGCAPAPVPREPRSGYVDADLKDSPGRVIIGEASDGADFRTLHSAAQYVLGDIPTRVQINPPE